MRFRRWSVLLACLAAAPLARSSEANTLAPDESRIEASRRADEMAQGGKHADAAALLGALAEENPYDGRLRMRLGHARRGAGDHDGAARAWEEGIALGFAPAVCAYNIACSRALQGRADEALEWLARAYELGWLEDELVERDDDFETLRSDPRFRTITGFPAPEGLSRAEQWRYDLDCLAKRMEQIHFDLYAKVSRERLGAEFEAMKAAAATASDGEMIAMLRRATALVGDGHTLVAALGTVKPPDRIPLEMSVFSDGLFVTGAPADAPELFGAEVTGVWGVSAQAALDAVKPYRSVDNGMGHLDMGPGLLTRPELLKAAGVGGALDRIELTVRGPGNEPERKAVVPAAAFEPGMYARLVSWPEGSPELPQHRRGADAPYELVEMPEERTLYVRWRAVDSMESEPFDRFCARLFERLDASPGAALVLDMRHNGGGNTGLIAPMIGGLASRRADGRLERLYVIIGRRTFSAAQNAVGQLEKYCDPVFVGEPTGSSPNFTGESTPLILPCTRVVVWCSNRRWYTYHSEDDRIWTAPHIAAPMSSVDWFAGRDPAMEAVLREERARKAVSRR